MLSFKGMVMRGEGRGKALGFPTANLSVKQLHIGFGVYAVEVKTGEKRFKGVLHFGPRKTFDGSVSIEVHLIGFSGDLYGSELEVSVKGKIRNVQEFENVEALKDQIKKDIEALGRYK